MVKIISEGESIGEVVVKGNLLQLNESLSNLYNRMIFITLIILGLITLLVFILQSSISRPISALSKTAKDIQNGNLKARVVANSKDEISELGNVFNEMVEQIVYEKEMSDLVLLTRNKFFSSIGQLTRDKVELLKLEFEDLKLNLNNNPALQKLEIHSEEL